MTVQHGRDVYRCELYNLDVLGIRVPVVPEGRVLVQTRRFTRAPLAVQWAEEQRRAILAGTRQDDSEIPLPNPGRRKG